MQLLSKLCGFGRVEDIPSAMVDSPMVTFLFQHMPCNVGLVHYIWPKNIASSHSLLAAEGRAVQGDCDFCGEFGQGPVGFLIESGHYSC